MARTVPAAVRELEDFVAAANPKGRSAQAMLSSVKKNAEAWRALMDNQQRHQLSDGVRRVVKRMRKSEDAGDLADTPLLNKLDGYLDWLQKAAQAAE